MGDFPVNFHLLLTIFNLIYAFNFTCLVYGMLEDSSRSSSLEYNDQIYQSMRQVFCSKWDADSFFCSTHSKGRFRLPMWMLTRLQHEKWIRHFSSVIKGEVTGKFSRLTITNITSPKWNWKRSVGSQHNPISEINLLVFYFIRWEIYTVSRPSSILCSSGSNSF